ncbi:MAG TPA: hypothetical protein VJ792_05430 [Candidatus Nitrosotalea sp.]|nr:hypothetical protein [Candidatus Nitrosotalea sp.]
MASSGKIGLLNFFGVKSSRKYILICIRCGSDSLLRSPDRIECLNCNKVLSIKAQGQKASSVPA